MPKQIEMNFSFTNKEEKVSGHQIQDLWANNRRQRATERAVENVRHNRTTGIETTRISAQKHENRLNSRSD